MSLLRIAYISILGGPPTDFDQLAFFVLMPWPATHGSIVGCCLEPVLCCRLLRSLPVPCQTMAEEEVADMPEEEHAPMEPFPDGQCMACQQVFGDNDQAWLKNIC